MGRAVSGVIVAASAGYNGRAPQLAAVNVSHCVSAQCTLAVRRTGVEKPKQIIFISVKLLRY